MRLIVFRIILISLCCFFGITNALAQNCVECHQKVNPNIVNDWQISKHQENDVTCSTCHGEKHHSAHDTEHVQIPTPETCAECHDEQVTQFKAGKHAVAWAAMKALPTAHWQPVSLMEGMKGCGGCHKLGLKTEAEIQELFEMTTDLKRGQSYIPDEILTKYNLTRQSIFETSNREQAQRMFNELIETAVKHMDKAMSYIVTIPREEARIRLFCLLPVFWAMRTLQKIQENTLQLLNKEKIKISRWIIKSELFKALFFTFSNRLTMRHYLTMRKDFALEMITINT